MLWPDVSFDVSGNRLRTALVGLRKALHGREIVHSESQSLALRPELFETDLSRARQLERRVQLAADTTEERAYLDELILAIGPGLLPDWDEEWLVGFQEDWRGRRIGALQRAADLALQGDEFAKARSAAESVLQELPYDAHAWSVLLNAMAREGQGPLAVRKFSSARKRMLQEAFGDFPAQLIQLAKSIRDGNVGPTADLPTLPAGVDQSIVRAFQRLLLSDPGRAMQFVCHDAFRLEILRTPEPASALLEYMVGLDSGEDDDRRALLIMAMRTYSLLHDVENSLKIGEILLTRELDPRQRRLTLANMSFGYFLMRNFGQAFRLIDEAIEVAERNGLPHHIHLTRADRALYMWHAGQDAEALEIYLQVFEAIKDESEELVSYAPAFLCGIIGSIYAGQDEIVEAEAWLRRGYGLAQVRQYREQMHQIEPAFGYIRARHGDSAEAARLTISGLAFQLRSQNLRGFGGALDYAAGALAALGRFELARAALQWGKKHRSKVEQPRSVAEAAFAGRVASLCEGVEPDGKFLRLDSPKRVLHTIAEALQANELPGS